MLGTEALGVEPLACDGFGVLPLVVLDNSGTDYGVFLFELVPSGGAIDSPYVPEVLGTDPIGVLPYDMPTAADVPLYFSDRGWMARPDDADVPNRYYEGRGEPVQLQLGSPLAPGTGLATLSLGELVIDNTDGQFDAITQSLGIDQRPITIKRLPSRSARYSDAVTIFTGVGQSWLPDDSKLHITMRDNAFLLEQNLLDLYAGSGGANGTAEMNGQPIMQVYGVCRNVSPQLVDPGKLIYRLHDRQIQQVSAVRVRGATVASAGSVASYSLLDSATVTSGTFKVALTSSGSYLRLGSSPDGPVTVDLLGDAFGGFVSDAASVMRRVLERRLSSEQLALATFSGLAARLPGAIGIVFNSIITVAEAVRQICNGTYTTLAPLPDGRLAVDQIADPYDGGMAIDATHLRDVPSPAALPDIISPCVWRLYVQYRRNWTQLGDSDVVPVPTITAAERAEILRQFRSTGTNDPNRLKGHAGARDIIFESLFDAEADAAALAVYMFNLFRPGRTLWVLPLANIGHSIMAGANLHVTWPRGELAGGKNMRVIGKSLEGRAVNLLALA